MSSYNISKLAVIQLSAYTSAENPNVTAISLHPGVVKTDLTLDMFLKFAKDTPALVGGAACWLSTEKAEFLRGKYVESHWSVDDLIAKKDEITKGSLSVTLKGDFGETFFE
jgi:NAD(P)-dependent dehydrogenase (short-subunit alcohol dehydrogenase family)